MSKLKQSILAAAVAVVSGSAAAQSVVTQRNLSFDGARDMALGALEACRKQGYAVSVTVLDRSGRTRVALHDDNANPHTIENSMRKAYTALTFRGPSEQLAKRAAANPSVLNLANVITGGGGLPVYAGKELIGSIGVSGAPGADLDAPCAQAGIDRIVKGLAQ
ncbi:MAG: hypothetical protein A3H91_04945 [Gammaproteobacteria bacterium RIFCSPLOWO2_02_FULL_61_13]|nr:MAG: hypothetical protein A3H91_04945 [Gammaproteobacteria bacterium RIFCSPLOWO2_02_FULL_61_13]